MIRALTTSRYRLHGLGIAVTGEPAVVAAIDARFRHAAAAIGDPIDLCFEIQRVTDAAQHTVAAPPAAARPVYEPLLGEVRYLDGADHLFIGYGERVHAVGDLPAGRVRVSIAGSMAELGWLLSHPLITLPLIEVMKRRGCYSLHAAGLSRAGRGLLFAGTSGAGKSTLTLALVRAGFDWLGDDMVFLEPGTTGPRLLAFPDEIDLTPETARLFPELCDLASQPVAAGWPKYRIDPATTYGAAIAWACRPVALVFPRVAHTERSRLRLLSRDEALLALTPNVLLTEARSAQAHLDALAELVRTCACYHLDTGRDLDVLPDLVRPLVEVMT